MKLSPVHVHSLSLFFAISYVGSVYILPAARLSLGTAGARRRDHPGVIRARILAASCSTVLSCVIVALAVKWVTPGASQRHALAQTLDLLGLYSIRAPLLSYFITPMLYLGPLYALFLEGALPGQTGWTYAGSARPLFASWVAIRNYWMGPFTEEVVFRACVLAVHELGNPNGDRSTKVRLVWMTPLVFGVAHVHHAWENWYRMGRTRLAAKRAVLGSVFQLAYTSLFGAHCAFLFLRTQSLWPTVTAHMWCNVMGVPQLADETRRFADRKISIYVAYLLGVATYVYGMRNWTLTEGTRW